MSVRLIPQVDNLRPRKDTTVISNLRPTRDLLRTLKIRKRQDSSRPISRSSGRPATSTTEQDTNPTDRERVCTCPVSPFPSNISKWTAADVVCAIRPMWSHAHCEQQLEPGRFSRRRPPRARGCFPVSTSRSFILSFLPPNTC